MAAISFAAHSHMGKVRTNNEDNLHCAGIALTPENRDIPFSLAGEARSPCLFAVCDGMGGHEQGEFASLAAVSALAELEEAIKVMPPGQVDALVQAYVSRVNSQLCDQMRETSTRTGTTLALVVLRGNRIHPYHIGDSRIYALRKGRLAQLTEDHTLVTQKVKMGILTPEQARLDSDRHKLTQYLGIFEDEMTVMAEPSQPLAMERSLRLLLCSDGLTDCVDDTRIAEILRSHEPAKAAEMLLNEALENGGRDNVTCIVLGFCPTRKEAILSWSEKIRQIFAHVAKGAKKMCKGIVR